MNKQEAIETIEVEWLSLAGICLQDITDIINMIDEPQKVVVADLLRFRVWDTVKKTMGEVQAIVFTEENVYPIYSKVLRRYIPFNEAILMQSTGLFDNSTPKKENYYDCLR